MYVRGECMANVITCIRIICSFALLFCLPLSAHFYALYIIAGVSDMVDGTVARKTGSVSEFGSKLDTVADFILFVICIIKLFPVLDIKLWMFVWIGIIAIVKAINIISGIIVHKKFVTVHSVMNKVVGILLFILPLTVKIIELRYSATVVCAVATFAAIHEGHYIRTNKN